MQTSKIKLFIILTIVILTPLALSLCMEFYHNTNTPMPLRQAMESSKNSGHVKKIIGDILSEGYSFNTYDVEGDSIKYRFYLVGNKASMSVLSQQKIINKKWIVLKSDTIITRN